MLSEHMLALVGVRLGLAALGVLPLGLEREVRNQPAGIRTTMVVSIAAALFTLTGIFGFGPGHDPSRVAAQVVSGIGFLGAGAIFFAGASVKGLTTAATIWGTAAVGVAAGAGFYAGVLIAAPEIALILALRPWTRAMAHGLAPRVTVHGAGSELTTRVVAALDQLGVVYVAHPMPMTSGGDAAVALTRLTLPRNLDLAAVVTELSTIEGVAAVKPEGLKILRVHRRHARHRSPASKS